MKRKLDVEAALRWAYVDELPKERALADVRTREDGVAPGWLRLERAAEHGQQVVDCPNLYGVLPDPFSLRPPHPDAVTIGLAVEGLATMAVDVPDDWCVFGDVAEADKRGMARSVARRALERSTLVDRDGGRRMRGGFERLIIRHAVLGGAPAWDLDPFDLVEVPGPNGRPQWFVRQVMVDTERGQYEIEVDGWDAKRKVPRHGAYKKRALEPEPIETAASRVDYELWFGALAVLAHDLADVLDTIAVTPSPRPPRPWETGDIPAPVVHRDLTEAAPTVAWAWGGVRSGLVLQDIRAPRRRRA